MLLSVVFLWIYRSAFTPLKYAKHVIFKGKPPLPHHMPSLRDFAKEDVTTLIVTMQNTISGWMIIIEQQ